MSLWFLRGLRRGVVTTRYPKTPPDPWTATLPTPPSFVTDRLDIATADALVAVCPPAALRREGLELVYDVGACTACGRCLVVADGAAVPSGQIELATQRREDLVKRVAIEGGVQ